METAEPKVSRSCQGHEILAEELASAVVDSALRDISRGHTMADREMDPAKEVQSYRPALSQAGLPVVGSLDYPDAPPSTPLLPELERSRNSFARKLKGDLSKVFSPSPPPSTPKEEEDCCNSAVSDARVELMEHLMQSLCTDDVARDYAEGGSRHGDALEAFAESLSHNIIDRALSSKSQKQTAEDSRLHLLAQQLAQTIITSSLDEAKMLI